MFFYFIILDINAPVSTSQLNLKQIIIKCILSNMNITDRQTLCDSLAVTFGLLQCQDLASLYQLSPACLEEFFSFTSVPVFISSLLLSFSHGSKYDLASSSPSPLNPFTVTHRPSSHRDRELEKGFDSFLWSYVAQTSMNKPNS